MSVFHSPGSDCVDLENDIFLPGSERFNTIVSEAVSDDNALYYVCGYLCKKFLSRHNCAECTVLLKSTKNMSSLSGSNATFTRFKAYSNLSDSKGLFVPADSFVSFMEFCEKVFAHHFMKIMHMPKLCQRLVNMVMHSADLNWFTADKCSHHIYTIVHLFMKMRIFYAVKFFNMTLSEKPRNKRNRKALILENL